MIPPASPNPCRPISTLLLCALLLFLGLPLLSSSPLLAQDGYDELDPSETYPTSLEIPVDGVTVEQLVNTWGAPRSRGRHHEGIDIFAPRNTPVRAVTDGVVYAKGYRGVGGRIIMVQDPLGYLHLYAHLESYGTQQLRERVYRGDILGYVGNSGNAVRSSCHLHYGISDPERKWINPYWVLARPELEAESADVVSDLAAPLDATATATESAGTESADHPTNPGTH